MHISSRPGGASGVRKVVMHLNAGPEVEGGARGLASYLGGISAGYHEVVDDKGYIVLTGPENEVEGASGMNTHGYHICLIGQPQSAEQWADTYSRGELGYAIQRARAACLALGVPPIHLSDSQVAETETRGICDHWSVNRAIVQPANARGDHSMGAGDHVDVGPNFPWDSFVSAVASGVLPNVPPPIVLPKPVPTTGGQTFDEGADVKTQLVTCFHKGFGLYEGAWDTGMEAPTIVSAVTHGPAVSKAKGGDFPGSTDDWWAPSLGFVPRAQTRAKWAVVTGVIGSAAAVNPPPTIQVHVTVV